MDAVVALGADLRAGRPPGAALAGVAVELAGESPALVVLVRERVHVAVQIAEAAGAPLADLLDRLDADLRARRAAALHSAAQAAGATATSWLLAALPLAGVGLGYTLGVDPGYELLHTRLGAGCVVVALAFQLGGLGWVARIARETTESAG